MARQLGYTINVVCCSLVLHSVHRSELPQRFKVTLVLAFSRERLRTIESICQSWEGPILAAVYLPLVASTTAAAEIAAGEARFLTQLGKRFIVCCFPALFE